MPIDWTTQQQERQAVTPRTGSIQAPPRAEPSLSPAAAPTYDALLTDLNAARAEAALWQRRLLSMQRSLDQARADLRACEKSHTEWEQAYAELLQQLRRLEVRFHNLQFERDGSDDMLRHYRNILGMVAKGEWLIPIDPEIYAA